MDLEEYYERQARYHKRMAWVIGFVITAILTLGVVAFVFAEEIVAP